VRLLLSCTVRRARINGGWSRSPADCGMNLSETTCCRRLEGNVFRGNGFGASLSTRFGGLALEALAAYATVMGTSSFEKVISGAKHVADDDARGW